MRASTPNVKPEIEILLCCARKSLGPAQRTRLALLLSGSTNWQLLIQLAEDNGLLPLLCEHLPQDSLAIPSAFLAKLRDASRRNALRSLFLTAELLRIADSLREDKIPALCYKGPVQSQLAYENPLLRQFDDLDIVVPQRFMSRVNEEMAILGYEPKFPCDRFLSAGDKDIPGEYVFLHKVNRAIVEFHTEATLRHFPRAPRLDEMLLRSAKVSLSGREVSTFSPIDTLLMLCVHGGKDFWSRLIWVADIAALVEMYSDADWQRLFSEARKCETERMVKLGLWLSHAIFNAGLPKGVLQDVQQDRIVARIGAELRAQLLHQNELPAGLIWRSLYRIRMAPRLGSGIRYWLRLSTAPTEEDWEMTGARHGHRAGYAFLRPLRLWRKYGHSADAKR